MDLFPETSPSLKGIFHSKSHKIVRLNTIERQSNIAELNIFQRKMTLGKVRINSLRTLQPEDRIKKLRKYTEVQEQLTSSQSPLRLSPFKQYESKLKISAESWVIHDMKQNVYKRGWKPNKVSSFNGLIRILVLFCYCQIIRQNDKLKRAKIKINHQLLKESKIKLKKEEINILKIFGNNRKTHKTFSQNSIVYLIDVVKSMIVSGNQDLLQYSLIYCGYLLNKMKAHSGFFNDDMISIPQTGYEFYANYFCNYFNQIVFKDLDLKNSKVQNKKQGYELISTPNQICQIFIKAFINDSLFKEITSMHRHSFTIKFQVGYNYWQDRTITLKSPRQDRKNQHFCCLIYKGTRNFEAICYNSDLDILMIIEDSKFSMADLDIKILENWYINVTKPIVSKHKISPLSQLKKKKTIFPVLEISKV